MNLHAITFQRPNMELIRAYIHAYYHMERTRINSDGASIDYQFDSNRWDNIDSRQTLTYTNAALHWDAQGRPPFNA